MGQRILVFESDPDFANAVSAGFSSQGVQVEVTEDGNEGLERASADPPDLILLSIELPSMNGFLVCKKIKKSPVLKDIPLVILSSDPNADEIFEQHKKLRTRAEDYIRKPVAFDVLFDHVRRLVHLQLDSADAAAVSAGARAVASAAPEPRPSVRVDEEIEAFAESAFDSLLADELASDPRSLDSDDAHIEATFVGSSEALVEDIERALAAAGPSAGAMDVEPARKVARSVPPPSPVPPEPDTVDGLDMMEEVEVLDVVSDYPAPVSRGSFRPVEVPSAPFDPVSFEPEPAISPLGDAGDLDESRRRVAALEAELARVRVRAADAERLEKQLAELKTKVARTGSISSREFLDLREALNRKDKEILELKDEVGSRDKQLLDYRESNLHLERTKADLEDRINQQENTISELELQLDTVTTDKDAAVKRGEDLKLRLERAEARAKKLEEALDSERQARSNEVEGLKSRHHRAVADLIEQHADAMSRAAAENQTLLEQVRADHSTTLEEAENTRRKQIESLKAQQAEQLEKQRQEREATLRQVAEHHAAEIAELNEHHKADIAQRAAHAEEMKQVALQKLRQELEAEMAHQLAEAEARRENDLQAQRARHAETLAAREVELEEAHNNAARDLNEEHARELAVLGRKLSESDSRSAELSERLREVTLAREELERMFDRRTEERDSLQMELRATRAQGEAMEKQHREQLKKIEEDNARVKERLDRMSRKLESDRELLDRARRAMSIGLGLLEDQRNNAVESEERSDEPRSEASR